ncbi:biotin/lipoate--protein ligase family protein [Ruegeria marina]|uniref:Biotin-(Acetyl-CoA carboxylase) ligase n=1 Tax=Ruegeria marina TaxID=639004 RepID=A0A1G7DH35_9RHOB|nr:biotin/lipoate--protein ligase family protein [Ruegeria marina]SDE50340.1 Biotin-(acetyl-CoA carboxylase) ligase [Ruegeria marina]
MTALSFPPAMTGEAVSSDPFDTAVMRAVTGCEAGLVTHRVALDRVGAALVLAPEVPLRDAIAMLPLCGVGFQNALGALAPPEVAVHLDWDGGLRVNGASCGRFRACAASDDPDTVPDWLVVGFTLPILPEDEETGLTPDRTALMSEGCAEVDPGRLVESWARHTLNWIARWEDEGVKSLHSEWRGLAWGLGEDITQNGFDGTFLGVDERFGMLLRDAKTTHLIPLTNVLEEAP